MVADEVDEIIGKEGVQQFQQQQQQRQQQQQQQRDETTVIDEGIVKFDAAPLIESGDLKGKQIIQVIISCCFFLESIFLRSLSFLSPLLWLKNKIFFSFYICTLLYLYRIYEIF